MPENLKVYKTPKNHKLTRASISNAISTTITAIFLVSAIYHFGGSIFDNETIGYTFDSRCGYVDATRNGDIYTIKYYDGDEFQYTFDDLSEVEAETEILTNYKTRKFDVSDEHYLLYHDVINQEKKNHHFADSIILGGLAAISAVIKPSKNNNRKR